MKKKGGKVKNKFDNFFLLTWKKLALIMLAWFVAVILHNFVYGACTYFFGENFWKGGDEAFFFILAVIIIPVYFLICLAYSLVKVVIQGTKKYG